MVKKINLFIIGDVTGVGFRSWTLWQAKKLGLTGWVRNVSKGVVEIVAEGEKQKLEELMKLCHQGPDVAWIEKVDVKWLEATGEFLGFEIKY